MIYFYFKEPIKTVTELAKYLEVDLSESQIKMISDFVLFENMKNLASFDMKIIKSIFKEDIEFLRKGEIGNWKNYLSEEISNKIDEVMRINLKYKRAIKYEPTPKI
jgi:hypothetical protein